MTPLFGPSQPLLQRSRHETLSESRRQAVATRLHFIGQVMSLTKTCPDCIALA